MVIQTKLFCVFDSKANVYYPPQPLQTRAEAIAIFSIAVNTPGNPLSDSPSDFSLFELADFDMEKATFHPLTAPERLCVGIEVLEQSAVATSEDQS